MDENDEGGGTVELLEGTIIVTGTRVNTSTPNLCRMPATFVGFILSRLKLLSNT